MQLIQIKNTINPYDGGEVKILEKLDNKIYILKESLAGYYFETHDDFVFPGKIYGKDPLFADHVLRYYNQSDKNVAVALVGNKGQGKSLAAKLICKKSNLPIIVIKNYINPQFMDFLNDLNQPLVIFIDEFEKIYKVIKNNGGDDDNEKQHSWLSILDGTSVYKQKHIFVFTSNEDLNDLFINRPSRIRYYKKYNSIDEDVFQQYVTENLKDPSKKEDVFSILRSEELNLDILSEIIKEINFSNLSVEETLSYFNYNLSPASEGTVTCLDPHDNVILTGKIKLRREELYRTGYTHRIYCDNITRQILLNKFVSYEAGKYIYEGLLYKVKSSDKINLDPYEHRTDEIKLILDIKFSNIAF